MYPGKFTYNFKICLNQETFGGIPLQSPFKIRTSAEIIIICQNILLMEDILHQLICSLSHYLQGFTHPFGGCLGFLNHQQ